MTPSSIYSGCATLSVNATREFAFFAFEPHGRPGTSTFGMLNDNKWSAPRREPQWPAIAMACARSQPSANWIVVALGQAGGVWEFTPETAAEQVTTIPGDYLGQRGSPISRMPFGHVGWVARCLNGKATEVGLT